MITRRQWLFATSAFVGIGGPAKADASEDFDLDDLSVSALLALQVHISDQLIKRGIVRSANAPTGDYAETLFCRAFGWELAPKSAKGYDAIDGVANLRIQIKARRLSKPTTSRQLSALRDLNDQPFELLAGVLFGHDYGIHRAALIPYGTVLTKSRYVEHTNSWRFYLNDNVWSLPDVVDITNVLKDTAKGL